MNSAKAKYNSSTLSLSKIIITNQRIMNSLGRTVKTFAVDMLHVYYYSI